MKVNHPFSPFYDKESKVLILGSFPSVKSREANFYYMHPQNRFWKILELVFNESSGKTINLKKNFLKRHHLALWDVIASCEIVGSADSSIKNVRVNDINAIIKNSNIKYIFTTGKKAYDLYNKYCFKETGIKAICLLSPSPANCAKSLDILVNDFKQLKNKL